MFLSFQRREKLLSLLVFTSLAAADGMTYAASETSVLEEVIVTATRRASNLQDTGATISATSAEALENRSVSDAVDLAQFSPGVNIASYQGDTSIFIRGIGTPTIIAGSDSSTATYVDGVFISRAAAINPAFFDIDRIEVLRGPQGTLYGRNATGGAINIITKGPTEAWQHDFKMTLGDYGRQKYFVASGGPITDSLGFRIAIQKEKRDGYTDVIRADNSSDEIEDRDDITLRAQLLWDINETMSVNLTGDYYRSNDKAAVFHFASTGYAEEFPNWYASREGAATGAYFAYRAAGRVSEPGSRKLYGDIDYENQTDVKGLTARFDWAMDYVDLAFIANYKSTNPRMQNEFDSSDAFVNIYEREEDHWQRSYDIQLSSNNDSAFSWIAGATWFEEENVIRNDIFGNFWEPILRQGFADLQAVGVLPAFPINIPESDECCTLQLNGAQETEAWAVYFDASLDIGERLRLHFGGRQSSEKRDGRQQFQLLFAGQRFAPNVTFFPAAVTEGRNGVPDPFGFVLSKVDGPAKFESFTPKIALDYRLSEDTLIYASLQKGFKTGGYNIGSSQLNPYKPEKIWSTELGLKTEWDRLRLNVAAFHYQYENLQAQDSVGNQPIIRNVGESEVNGLEIEFLAYLTESWSIDGSVTYLSAEFTKGSLTEPLRPAPLTQAAGSVVRDLDGLSLTRAPEWQGSLGVQYRTDIADGQLLFRADYSYQSKVFYTVFNIDAASQAGYGVANLRAQYQPDVGDWKAALFVKNLNDKTYFGNQILTGTVYGAEFVGALAAPRTWGLELSYSL